MSRQFLSLPRPIRIITDNYGKRKAGLFHIAPYSSVYFIDRSGREKRNALRNAGCARRAFPENQELFLSVFLVFLLFRFELGETFAVGEGDIAFDLTVVEDVGFAVFEVAEEADQVNGAADAEPES